MVNRFVFLQVHIIHTVLVDACVPRPPLPARPGNERNVLDYLNGLRAVNLMQGLHQRIIQDG